MPDDTDSNYLRALGRILKNEAISKKTKDSVRDIMRGLCRRGGIIYVIDFERAYRRILGKPFRKGRTDATK